MARPYLVDTTVNDVSANVSGVPFALVRLSRMSVDPIGAELTCSRAVTASPGGTVTTLRDPPKVSWEGRSGELSALAFSWTSMALFPPFLIDTGICPDAPPIGTCGETTIWTLPSSPLR